MQAVASHLQVSDAAFPDVLILARSKGAFVVTPAPRVTTLTLAGQVASVRSFDDVRLRGMLVDLAKEARLLITHLC